jgi:hypothetical protein
MPKIIKKKSKTVPVRQHPRRIRISEKNPSGITIEIIQLYKGILKDESKKATGIMVKFRKKYEILKK